MEEKGPMGKLQGGRHLSKNDPAVKAVFAPFAGEESASKKPVWGRFCTMLRRQTALFCHVRIAAEALDHLEGQQKMLFLL
jgi:hypothetical protein